MTGAECDMLSSRVCWMACAALPGWISFAWMRECRPGINCPLALGVCAAGAWLAGTAAL
ncbi:MAG: hypothetical protein PVSMB1_05090 [Gemmatimonadaceae bacterium]